MSTSTLKEIEHIWKKETQKGNQCYNTSSLTKAKAHYMKAMAASELLFANAAFAWQQAVPVPKLYYTACINLANTYRKAGDNKNAAGYFLYCTFKIKQMCYCSTFDNDIQQTAILYWRKAVSAFSAFSQEEDLPLPVDITKDETYHQITKLKVLFDDSKRNLN